MNITAYASEITIKSMQSGEYQVIDAPASVGKKYPAVIGHVTRIRGGFLHFTGDRYSHMKGIEAVFAPNMAEGPNHTETIRRVLREGLANGRDDRS